LLAITLKEKLIKVAKWGTPKKFKKKKKEEKSKKNNQKETKKEKKIR
jgi:hypothetical protein